MGEIISFPTPGGGTAKGYLASAAAGASAPGVIVLQEWWGLNDQIKGVADRFAAQGYNAIAPDLYAGRVTQDPDEANHLMTGLDWVGATEQDVRGAVQHLKAGGGKVAVMGFCMGGALTVIAGVKIPEVDAAVPFYGIPPMEAADPAKTHVPIQGHFANTDDWCTPEAVNGLEQALKSSGVTHEIYRYDGEHGFFNEQRPDVYNAAATKQSWDRMMTFLKRHL